MKIETFVFVGITSEQCSKLVVICLENVEGLKGLGMSRGTGRCVVVIRGTPLRLQNVQLILRSNMLYKLFS